MPNEVADVIVVGAGNAAFCAALAAQEQGAKVLMLEAAAEDESGGNSRFTAGSIRVVYNGIDDIKTLVPDLTPAEIETTDFGTYTADQFFDDMARVTQHRADPDLVELLVTKSFDLLNWMRQKGVRLIPIYGRQAFKIDGKFKFWGGLTVESVGGGPGLVAMLTEAAKKRGIEIRYQTRGLGLLFNGSRVEGVRVREKGEVRELRGKSVVLACGGFEANAGMAHPLSRPGLGSRQGARLALQHRRRHPHGDRDRRRAARQLVGLPRRAVGNATRPSSAISRSAISSRSIPIRSRSWSMPPASASSTRAPISATTPMPNTAASVLEQPGQFAWQIFDQKSEAPAARRIPHPPGHQGTANTLEEFAEKLEGVNAAEFLETIKECNAAVHDRRAVQSQRQGRPLHDGARHQQKQLGQHDRYAAVRGLRGDLRHDVHLRRPAASIPTAQVLNTDYQPIPGLYAAGELVGGLFYFNYPGGSGLMSGTVFGKIAGTSAGRAGKN